VNEGVAVKFNVNQRYATDSAGYARVQLWAEQADVPLQTYVHRSELSCGSTIGPISATRLGIRTVDLGAPMWSMHSARESAGVMDQWWLYRLLTEALQSG
jgi:aspartyl aminopeptidase